MRSIGTLAVVTGTLVLASACSDGAGTPPPGNERPVANFDLPACTLNVACPFTSSSTDDVAVTEWSWDFNGDNRPDANTATATYTYSAAGTFIVSLRVKDAEGLENTKTTPLTLAPPANTPPTAGFTHSCTNAECSFTSTSSDAAPGSIASYAWSFGDGGTSDLANPSHSYSVTAATEFTVTLTVTDNGGATDVETQTITATPAPNVAPTAGFTFNCRDATCTFTSTSSDPAPGTIVSHAWTFGDDGTSAVTNPIHSYAITAPKTYTVTLTVTDNEGVTDVETQTLSVAPPAPTAEGCVATTARVECAFNITARSTVKLKLLGISCDLSGQKITAPPPIGDQVFLGVCRRTVGEELGIFGGPLDEAIIYEAGSQLRIRFDQGVPFGGADPVVGPPAATFTGAYPDWTINFEDGQHPGAVGEPDFSDVVLGVRATVVP